jgi:hypothetical protein
MPADHRRFLLSIKSGAPEWALLGLPGAESLPAVRWRLASKNPACPRIRIPQCETGSSHHIPIKNTRFLEVSNVIELLARVSDLPGGETRRSREWSYFKRTRVTVRL